MDTTTIARPPAAGKAAKWTMGRLSEHSPFTPLITWPEVLELIHEAQRVSIVFTVVQADEPKRDSAAAIEVTRSQAAERANWSARARPGQMVRVYNAGTHLFIGG